MDLDNKKIIIRKLDFILDRFETLNEIKKNSNNKNSDKTITLALERILEEIIESLIKINMIILKDKNIFPKSYANSFYEMKKILKMDEELTKNMINLARFRNELAHEYIDMSDFYFNSNLEIFLKYFPAYLKKLNNFLGKD